jgi:hypothetical protein
VIDHRSCWTGGTLCCHALRAAPRRTYADDTEVPHAPQRRDIVHDHRQGLQPAAPAEQRGFLLDRHQTLREDQPGGVLVDAAHRHPPMMVGATDAGPDRETSVSAAGDRWHHGRVASTIIIA